MDLQVFRFRPYKKEVPFVVQWSVLKGRAIKSRTLDKEGKSETNTLSVLDNYFNVDVSSTICNVVSLFVCLLHQT